MRGGTTRHVCAGLAYKLCQLAASMCVYTSLTLNPYCWLEFSRKKKKFYSCLQNNKCPQMPPHPYVSFLFFLSFLPPLWYLKELIRGALQRQTCHSKEHPGSRGGAALFVRTDVCLHISSILYSLEESWPSNKLSWDDQNLSVMPVKPSIHSPRLHYFPSQPLLALFFCQCSPLTPFACWTYSYLCHCCGDKTRDKSGTRPGIEKRSRG